MAGFVFGLVVGLVVGLKYNEELKAKYEEIKLKFKKD